MTTKMGIALDLLIAEGFPDEAEEIRTRLRERDALAERVRRFNENGITRAADLNGMIREALDAILPGGAWWAEFTPDSPDLNPVLRVRFDGPQDYIVQFILSEHDLAQDPRRVIYRCMLRARAQYRSALEEQARGESGTGLT